MPVACSTTVLSGVDGSVAFKPAATRNCLLDFTDFPAGTKVTVPVASDYRVNDPVVFTEQGQAKLDTGLESGVTVWVVFADYAAPQPTISVAATKGGAPLTLEGDGGTGTGDTANPESNHITIAFAEHMAVCQVQSWTMNLAREEVDTTSLQCGPGAGGGAGAPFRTKQAGYVDGSGSMVIRFTRDQTGLSRRLLQNSLRKNQDGASVQLFIDTIYDGAGKIDEDGSMFLEGPISILGFDIGVTVGSEPTQGTISFSFSDQPTNIFGAV